MSALLATITLLLCITTVDAYDIEHRESMVYVTKGSTAILPCVITGDYDTGKDAVNWEKYMLEDDTTGRHVSSAANAAVPFRDTGRYSVLYKKETDRLDYSIQITNAKLEDAGRFICEAGNKQRTTYLYVVDPVKSVTIAGAKNAADNATLNPTSLEYFTDQDGKFECVVSGGNSKPNVALYIGSNTKNVVALFAPHMKVDKKKRGETVGLQYFEYTVTRSSYSFRLKPEHDGKKIRCVGSVGHGVDDVEQEVEVRVIGKPTFLPCNTTVSATTGMEKFEITCGFRSRPMYEMTRWFAETTGQSIENEGSADGMQATVTTKDNHFVATLRINLVAPESFQPYKLSVTNSQGTDSITIKLERGKDPAKVSSASAARHVVALLVVAVSVVFIFC